MQPIHELPQELLDLFDPALIAKFEAMPEKLQRMMVAKIMEAPEEARHDACVKLNRLARVSTDPDDAMPQAITLLYSIAPTFESPSAFSAEATDLMIRVAQGDAERFYSDDADDLPVIGLQSSAAIWFALAVSALCAVAMLSRLSETDPESDPMPEMRDCTPYTIAVMVAEMLDAKRDEESGHDEAFDSLVARYDGQSFERAAARGLDDLPTTDAGDDRDDR